MAIRAYIVPVRNDLSDSLTQFVDVEPNTSQYSTLAPVGQTGYINPGSVKAGNAASANLPVYQNTLDFDVPGALTANGSLNTATNAAGSSVSVMDGLCGWLLDNIEVQAGGKPALSSQQAASAARRIFNRAVKGLSLTEADIVACVNATNGVGGGGDPGLVNLNTGACGQVGAAGAGQLARAVMVEQVLRILAGDQYRAIGGGDAVGAKFQSDAGAYTDVVHNPPTADGAAVGASNIARAAFLTAPNTNTAAAQSFPASLDYVPRRKLYAGASLTASAQEGQLAKFAGHWDDATPFAFQAAKLADGSTTATYGGTGTARGLQKSVAITSISKANVGGGNNTCKMTTATAHGLVANDVIRVRGLTVVGTVLSNTTYKVKTYINATSVALKTIGNADIDNTGSASDSLGGAFSLESDVPVVAAVSATDSINIAATGATAHQFRAVVVYDEAGNVLSV